MAERTIEGLRHYMAKVMKPVSRDEALAYVTVDPRDDHARPELAPAKGNARLNGRRTVLKP
ncbi:hypothetical protein [Sandarakinorhabdus sp.]|uniref:hypothetical protein n=1 Tax=Sandarakinorhabdus sp. TaxID=1916663 RepID=UPI00286E1291|nr:hypothetical protein [Sandarakinorhabdus sp.]